MRKESKQDSSSHHHDDMTLEVSNDSDKMVTDQITGTLDLINKIIEVNIQSDSSEPADQFFNMEGKNLDRRESYRYSKLKFIICV